jgi:hypothetical protein
MLCPSKECGSPNTQPLAHYQAGLSPDSASWKRYAQPAAPETRTRLILAAVAAVGVALAVTGSVGFGLLLLAVGAVGAVVVHQRIAAVEADREMWGRRQICLACTHLWEP